MSTKGNLPLASKKQEYIDGLGNAHEWTNADTCARGNFMQLDIVEVDPVDPNALQDGFVLYRSYVYRYVKIVNGVTTFYSPIGDIPSQNWMIQAAAEYSYFISGAWYNPLGAVLSNFGGPYAAPLTPMFPYDGSPIPRYTPLWVQRDWTAKFIGASIVLSTSEPISDFSIYTG